MKKYNPKLEKPRFSKNRKNHSPISQVIRDADSIVRVMATTPYAVFVRSSPVYGSSRIPNRRVSMSIFRPSGRYHRRLPFRPDPYPYADEKWSKMLVITNDVQVKQVQS